MSLAPLQLPGTGIRIVAVSDLAERATCQYALRTSYVWQICFLCKGERHRVLPAKVWLSYASHPYGEQVRKPAYQKLRTSSCIPRLVRCCYGSKRTKGGGGGWVSWPRCHVYFSLFPLLEAFQLGHLPLPRERTLSRSAVATPEFRIVEQSICGTVRISPQDPEFPPIQCVRCWLTKLSSYRKLTSTDAWLRLSFALRCGH